MTKTREEWTALAVKIIRTGKADEHLDQIRNAVSYRQKVVELKTFDEIKVGQSVRYVNTVRPVRLRGKMGRVVEKKLKKVTVELDDGRRIVTPISCIEVVHAIDVANEQYKLAALNPPPKVFHFGER